MGTFNRRQFLSLGGAAVAAGFVGGLSGVRFADATAGLAQKGPTGDPILIVVDLQGGNDALNTLVPTSGRYHDLRPTLALPDDDLLTFAGLDFGVHPGLAALQPLWDAGQVTALYGTGLAGQGRSHFVAQDAWRSANPGVPAESGWLGRWLELAPPTDAGTLRAVALGQSTLAAEGEQGRPVAVQSVDGFRLQPPRGNTEVTDAVLAMGSPVQAGLLGRAQAALPDTVEAVDLLQGLIADVDAGDAEIDIDDDQALFTAARAIIQGDVGTQVLYVTIDGFDTHALQAPRHDQLLRTVAGGLSDLFDNLEASEHADRTLALVVSEFGRRCGENGSAGTDHGKGGLSLLVGPPVAESTVIGEPDLDDLDDGDLGITIDARSMYHDALTWLGATDDDAVTVLGGDWKAPSLLHA